MKVLNSKENIAVEQKADVKIHLPFSSLRQNKKRFFFVGIFLLSTICFVVSWFMGFKDDMAIKKQQAVLQEKKQRNFHSKETTISDNTSAGIANTEDKEYKEPEILAEYEKLYEQNKDLIGWLRIGDTVIDYPVMQCVEDENYYLSHDFYKDENKNGSLVLDSDSHAGVGIREQEYVNGSKPSTNLIIHGHTMKSGQMFGNLKLYHDREYGLSHNIIYFHSLYEKREYELISVFYSQVYYESEEVFKYYTFFQADTQEEFDDWYRNIKEMSLYDTGVSAKWGDEFLTLSCCAYHVNDGRFVVVAKRK